LLEKYIFRHSKTNDYHGTRVQCKQQTFKVAHTHFFFKSQREKKNVKRMSKRIKDSRSRRVESRK